MLLLRFHGKAVIPEGITPSRSHRGRGNNHSALVTRSVLFLFHTSALVAVEFLALQGAYLAFIGICLFRGVGRCGVWVLWSGGAFFFQG